jgi:hypothetical protein
MFERVLWASYTRVEAYENPMPLSDGNFRSCTWKIMQTTMGKWESFAAFTTSEYPCHDGWANRVPGFEDVDPSPIVEMASPFFIRAKVTHVALSA